MGLESGWRGRSWKDMCGLTEKAFIYISRNRITGCKGCDIIGISEGDGQTKQFHNIVRALDHRNYRYTFDFIEMVIKI